MKARFLFPIVVLACLALYFFPALPAYAQHAIPAAIWAMEMTPPPAH